VTPRVHAEWKNRVAAEYRSAAITAQLVHKAIQVGFPDELVRTGLRIVADELDHAALSHDALVALGGEDEPGTLDVAALENPTAPEGPLATLCDGVVRDFCLGETFAVPLFAAMREGTTHPTARAALDRILRDEAAHRAFGWDALDALLDIDPDGVRARIRARLPAWLASFERGYGTPRPSDPLLPEEREAGLLAMEDYVRIWRRAVAEDVMPRFAKRGV
jgi:hypothetical protein